MGQLFRGRRRRSLALVLSTVAACVGVAGLAFAAVPGEDGSVSACYKPADTTKGGAALLVVDADAGGKCKDGFASLQLASGRSIRSLQQQIVDLRMSMPPPPPAADPWHYVGEPGEPAFQGTWTNHGGEYERVSFRTDAGGVVRLRGLITSESWSTPMFTLPDGYRPAAREILSGQVHGGSWSVRIDVDSDGRVAFVSGGGNLPWISLSGISFLAAPTSGG